MRRYQITGDAAQPPSRRPPRHRINAAQLRKYRVEWSLCRRALRAGGLTPEEADATRHELHVKTLGVDISSTDLNDRQLDLLLGAFRAISQPANLQHQLDAQSGPLRRLIHGIEKLDKANPGYIAQILIDMAYSADWRKLTDIDELIKLRATLARRIGEKSKAAKRPKNTVGGESPRPLESSVPSDSTNFCDGCGELTATREQTGHGARAKDETGFHLCDDCLSTETLKPF